MCDLDHDGRARKDHRCDECSRMITAGAPYRKIAGTHEGDFWAMKVCKRCMKAMEWLMGRGHGWKGGRVLDDVRECVEQELLEKAQA